MYKTQLGIADLSQTPNYHSRMKYSAGIAAIATLLSLSGVTAVAEWGVNMMALQVTIGCSCNYSEAMRWDWLLRKHYLRLSMGLHGTEPL